MRVVELAASCQPAFARHETFHPRFGWLRKAYVGAMTAPDLFAQPGATVTLGVGKNMVHAIRYWGLAFKVLEIFHDSTRPRRPGVKATELALALFSEDGWDPYLEETATLWLLHWQLLRSPCIAPTWWTALNLVSAHQFDDTSLADVVVAAAGAVDGWPGVVPTSIKKDVDCFIRMYAQRSAARHGLDDLLDCPFRELGLVESASRDTHAYRFNFGPKPGLPDVVVTFAALDYVAMTAKGASTISVARLANDLGGPGQTFKLSEYDIFDALQRVADTVPAMSVAEPAGLKQLYIDGSPVDIGRALLADYYRTRTGSVRRWGQSAPTRQDLEAELRELERSDVGANVRDRIATVRAELNVLAASS